MVLPWVPGWVPVRALLVVLAIILSIVVLRRLGEGWEVPARDRFVFGVPWGTVLTVGFVACVYLFVQDGWANPRDPLVLPFRSWSYEYPTGMLASAFAHGSWSHVASNLTATVVYAGIAEYAWGHYPRERGVQTFTSLRTNPYVRILAVPVAAVFVGLFTALFSAGPLVGFSGVVFAFFGAALLLRPLLAAVGLLVYEVLWRVVQSVANPEFTARPISRVITPWWADTAIHTHAIGLFIGVLVGVALCWRRDEWPTPRRLWFGTLAFAVMHGLWAIFVPLGNGRFRLFRWVGVAAVFVLAAVLVAMAARQDRPILPRFGPSVRTVGVAIVVLALLVVAVPAIPLNLAPIGEEPAPNAAVEVRDYTVGYAENVPDGYAAAASAPFIGAYPRINRTGVIVVSEQRRIWSRQIGGQQLQNRGRASFDVGGLGWRETVTADWNGWSVRGNASVYEVALRRDGGPWRQSFTSPERRADVRIANRTVGIRPAEDHFEVVVARGNETLEAAPVPADGIQLTVGGLTVSRHGSTLFAGDDGTRVPIAERQHRTGDR